MHIVIIGIGISGVSTAQSLRKTSNANITLVSSESNTFFSRPTFRYVFMGNQRFKDILPLPPDYWTKNKINFESPPKSQKFTDSHLSDP